MVLARPWRSSRSDARHRHQALAAATFSARLRSRPTPRLLRLFADLQKDWRRLEQSARVSAISFRTSVAPASS
jgi:hypothetical protein